MYDFIANESIHKYLLDVPKTLVGNKGSRYVDHVPSAILYLHEGYQKVVIHIDVKAKNVLLVSELYRRI